MEVNLLLISVIVVIVACVIRGATKGMLRIIFGIAAWIFLICFVNYGSGFAADYLNSNTTLPQTIQEGLTEHLHDRYYKSEEKEAGSGQDAILELVPLSVRESVAESVQNSLDAFIEAIAGELTLAALKGIATIIAIIIGILIIFIISKVINAIGLIPGIKDVNRFLGVVAGLLEGMLIVWLFMFIANCFPASALGTFIIENAKKDQILYFIYQNNLIEGIIGI